MDYLPTLGEKWPHSKGNVGKYSLHGASGLFGGHDSHRLFEFGSLVVNSPSDKITSSTHSPALALFHLYALEPKFGSTSACHSCAGVMHLYTDITGSDSTGYILSPHLGETWNHVWKVSPTHTTFSTDISQWYHMQ